MELALCCSTPLSTVILLSQLIIFQPYILGSPAPYLGFGITLQALPPVVAGPIEKRHQPSCVAFQCIAYKTQDKLWEDCTED